MDGDTDDNNPTMAILVNSLDKLLHKDVLTKPSIFVPFSSISIKQHIETVDKYCKFISASSSLQKVLILWETLDDAVRNEIIFDPEYDSHSENYEWLSKKLTCLFPLKTNKTTDLLELHQIRQSGRTLEAYASVVKQECAKRRNSFQSNELQRVATNIFISGLDNELYRKAVKRQNPANVEEAVKLLKNLKPVDGDATFCKVEESSNKCNCKSLIDNLVDKIDYLQKLVIGLQRNFMTKNNANSNTNRNINNNYNERQKFQSSTRFNQQHNLRSNKQIKCYTCGRFGHISRNCRQNTTNRVRNLEYDEMPPESESNDDKFSTQTFVSNVTGQQNCALIVEKIPKCDFQTLSLNEQNNTKPINKKQPKKPVNKQSKIFASKCDSDVLSIEKFINGGSLKKNEYKNAKKAYSMTVISKASSEKAKNKPIVKGNVNFTPAKIFLDSGADTNIIDGQFALNVLGVKSSEISKTGSTIKCANGSSMSVIGECKLMVNFCGLEKKIRFLLVNNLFPRVIIGISAMKDLNVEISPPQSCAFVNNVKLPFISRVVSDEKNETELCLRVGAKLI